MSWVHKDFQLNNSSFQSSQELIQYSKNISDALYFFLTDWFSANDFVVVKTSGSTGEPKDIQLKKAYMKNSALATGEFFEIKEKTTALCCLPIDFIAGKMMVVRAMILGWHLDVVEPSSNPLETIDKSYDFSAMVPLQLSNSLNKIDLISQLIVGGGVVSNELEQAIQRVFTKIYATYGMTETITHVAVKSLQGGTTKQSHYQILPNVTITQDHRNCLVINAPKVSDEEIITNDVVEIISPTKFEWKGRFDNVINSGGIKLHPEEIEKKLAPYIESRFFVTGLPDEQLGEKLVLVVEGNIEQLTLDEVEGLTKYKTPREILFVPEFQETPTGKIQRKKTLETLS